jgi:hypothetical protein
MPKPYTSTQIYHITDTFDYRARGKIAGAYTRNRGRIGLRDAGYEFTPGLDSVDIGISVHEFITHSQRPDRIIAAVNYAPPDKQKKTGATKDNVRNDFFCAQLKDGVVVCGTSNGHEFSYVRDRIVDLYRLTNTNSLGSQFRSLEILPEHTMLFSDPKQRARLVASGILQQEDNIDTIIPLPPRYSHVHEIDNFQNVKIYPSLADLELLRRTAGKPILFGFGRASVENATRKTRSNAASQALVTEKFFDAGRGNNIVALHSSSRSHPRTHGEEVVSNIPMIATLRDKPARTSPNYPVPRVSAQVQLAEPRTAA